MSREGVLPAFNDVPDSEAALALSEPFIKPEDFEIELGPNRDGLGTINSDSLVAMGTSYVGEDGAPQFEYAMHPLVTAPYAAAQAFADGYSKRFAPSHKMADEMKRLDMIGYRFWQSAAIEYATRNRLKTMSAYAVLFTETTGYVGAVIAARSIVREAPLEGREEQLSLQANNPALMRRIQATVTEATGASDAQANKAKKDIATNTGQEDFGLFVAMSHMPQVAAAKKIVDAHPEIGGFLSLPRKKRRELLREEQKG